MVLDKIENSDLYTGVSKRIAKAFAFIKSTDLLAIELGKHVIDNDDVFAVVSDYETKDISEGVTEAHCKYLDVQYVVSGSEVFGYAPLKDQTVTQAYSEEKDVTFFRGELSFNKLDAGMFAIFLPDDVHMPGVKLPDTEISKVRKVVVRVKL